MVKKLLLAFFLLASFARAVDYAMYFSYVGTAAGAASSSAQKQIGTSVAYHKLAWNKSGTVGACAVKAEQSATGTSGWTDLIAAQTCTSNGTTVINAGSVNYVRITFSTPVTGSGSVTASYSGYINLPLTDPPLFASWTAKSFVYSDALKQAVTTAAPTDGQLLIGKSGDVPVIGSIAGTSNQITSTPGAGTITLSTPQDIATTSTPQFTRIGIGEAADATIPVVITTNPASTNTILELIKATRSTSATAGAGIGGAFTIYSEDASGNLEEAGRFAASFPTATHSGQTGRVNITALGASVGLSVTSAGAVQPITAAGGSLGAATLPFGDIYLAGTSSTPAANNFRITGASTDGTMTVTLPDADTQTVRSEAGAPNEFLTSLAVTGIFSHAQPAFTNISGIATTTQGGTGANLSAAGAGTYPKASGAGVYAASTLAASGVGTPTACTNQFVTGFTLAGDAAPVSTCTAIVAGDLGTTMTPQFARIGLGAAADATDPLNVYNGNALFKYGHIKFISEAVPGAPTSGAPTAGGSCTDGSHVLVVTFVTANGETEYGAVSAAQTCGAGNNTIPLSAVPTGTSGVTTGRNTCASKAGTTTPLYQVGASPTIGDNTTLLYNFVTADASLTVLCNNQDTTTSTFYRDGVLMGFAGAANTSWGVNAGYQNTGVAFTGVGVYAGYQNTGASFTGVGVSAGNSNTGAEFTGVGLRAGYQNTGVAFTGVGVYAGYQNTGASFTGVGVSAGRYLADGSTGNTTSTYSLFLGADTKAAAAGETNQIVIGYDTIGAGSNTATLGNTSVVKTVLRGHVGTTQAAVPTLSACGTGTPAMEAGSTDHRGFFTTGGGVLTSCTMTFNIAYAVRPACAVYGDNAVAVVGLNWTTAVGTLVVQATSMTSQTFGYICQ